MHLAIDTSTDTASIALVQDSEVLAELTWRCGQNHSVELLPNLVQLLNQTKLSLQSADAVQHIPDGPSQTEGKKHYIFWPERVDEVEVKEYEK